MNSMQELILEQIEDYKNELAGIEKIIIEKVKGGKDFEKELEKAKWKKLQIEHAFLMIPEKADK